MGTGYTRNDTGNNIADGNVINASDLDGEFDAVESAFNGSTGHSHDGTTGEGPQIDTAGIADDAVTGDKIDSTTTVTAASFVGPVTGNVTGNLTGDVTGNADTATALETSRTIAGQSFDGTANISIAPTDLTGVTATASEINALDGITSTVAELNLVDGSVAGTVTNSKAVIYGASGEVNATTLQVGGTAITATPAELNTLDGITASTAELNIMDGVTATTAELNIMDGVTATSAELNLVDGSSAGTVVNSKAAVYSAAGALNATSLQVGGVAITATPAELNILDGVTATTGELNILDGVTATASELNILDGVTATTAELNYLDITTLGTSQASKALTADGSGDVTIGGGLTTTGSVKVQQIKEKATVSATAATGTINIDAITQQVVYYTSNASGNFTLNIRGDGSNTLNSIMSTGESLSIAFLVTNGATAYYASAFQVDGSSVTPKFVGGAPSGGTASAVDAYLLNVIKTADATFTVFGTLSAYE